MYLFDTNAFALLLSGEPNTLRRVKQQPEALYLSSVSAEELLVGRLNGLNRARSPRTSLSLVQAHEDFVKALADIQLLPLLAYFNEADRLFRNFPPAILRLGSQDCRIAAQAMAHGLTVVTRNLRDFDAIGAPCEDWSA